MVCSGVRPVTGLCVCCGMLLCIDVCRLDFSCTNKKRSPHNLLCGDLLCGEVKRIEMSQRIERRAYTADLILLRSFLLVTSYQRTGYTSNQSAIASFNTSLLVRT